jgi:glutathione synthase/RimK-type ligase-like ATP-grasp enzyme
MILVYGRGDDAPVRAALDAAREHDVPMIWLDQSMLDRHDLLLSMESGSARGLLSLDGCQMDLGSISGIYARPLELPSAWRDELARTRAHAFHELFLEWLEIAPRLVVNRPSDMESNSSKPYQSQLIALAGFDVPETLVTSDPDDARAFWREYGRVIFKSISGVRSIVTELDDAHAAHLDRLTSLPVQLQAFVTGEDVRVHVVGERTFGCLVESGATDYRYAWRQGADARLASMDLPACVSSRCVELAQRLRLPFCGIDLRRTANGRWVCFEVNPMPAYTYFENETGLPISRAVIDLLASG